MIMKYRVTTSSILLAVVFWIFGSSIQNVTAQITRSDKMLSAVVNESNFKTPHMKARASLESILEYIQAKYDVKFFYGDQTVKGKYGPTPEALLKENPGEHVAKLLDSLHLTYAKVDKSTYVIFPMATSDRKNVKRKAQFEVSGIVTDASSKQPIPGVNILVAGTNTGTATDSKGHYSLSVSSSNDTLVFSYIGYQSKTIAINGRHKINVALSAQTVQGQQMVVIGYGEQKKSSLTGAISSVSSKEISSLPVASVQEELQGRVAGVKVTNNGGPGSQPIIQIRGISSISFATNPLYVVDGQPTSSIGDLQSTDIASVQVLKDASAAAIYGSRATNGVILITTKKGEKNGGLRVNYNSYVGEQSVWHKLSLLNTPQYVQYATMIDSINGGLNLPPRLQPGNFNQPIYPGANQTFAQTNTNWQDAYFRRGLLTNQHLSLSGGNKNTRFYIAGGFFKQDGIAVGLNYHRGNLMVNSDHKISKVFSFGENLNLSYSRQRYDNTGGNRTRLVNVVRELPYIPVYDPTAEGGFRSPDNSIDGADPSNPVERALLAGDAHNNIFDLVGNAYINVNITPWLTFRSVFGLDHVNDYNHQFNHIRDDKGRDHIPVATITNSSGRNTSHLFTEQLTFDKTFGPHHIDAVAVYELQGDYNYTENSSGQQSTNNFQTLAGATNLSVTSTENKNLLKSYVGRLNYQYAGKYLLSLSFRRDGFSIWAPGHKWSNFPSASVGWRIDKEAFMQNQDLISELKLRAGYGVTGLNGSLIGNNYPWQAQVEASAAQYPFGGSLAPGNASYYETLNDSAMVWEKTKQLNVGLNLGLLANKITLTADYYKRRTNNLLLSVPTPTSLGFLGTGVLSNVGEMENKGLDVQLGYHKVGGKFTFNVTGLVSVVRNKVLKLNTPNASIPAGGDTDFGGGDPLTLTEAGQPIQSFYGFVVQGIFQNWDQVYSSAYQKQAVIPGKVDSKGNPVYDKSSRDGTKNTAPGDLKFADLNHDGVINSDDKVFLGSYLPKFTYSLNYDARYKHFDLSLFFQGVYGNKIFDAANIIRTGMARLFGASTDVLNAWTPQNKNTNIPRAVTGDPNGNTRPSTRWIEDGSYLRLKNVQLGYTVPNSVLQSWTGGAVRRFRIYVSSQNLLTITGYKGWDPEIGSKNGTLTNGVDYGQYPAARSFLVGIQLGM